jgi:hypothetical protein
MRLPALALLPSSCEHRPMTRAVGRNAAGIAGMGVVVEGL